MTFGCRVGPRASGRHGLERDPGAEVQRIGRDGEQRVGDRGDSCPTPSLAADVARTPADAAVRVTFAEGVGDLVRILQSVDDSGDAGAARQAALADYAMMVGALLMARATAGQTISEELLDAARSRLNEAPAAPIRVGARTARK